MPPQKRRPPAAAIAAGRLHVQRAGLGERATGGAAMVLATGAAAGLAGSRRGRLRRETLWALAIAIVLNVLLLGLLTLGDRAGVWLLRPAREATVRLDLFRPPRTQTPKPQPAVAHPAAAQPAARPPPVPVPPSAAPIPAPLAPEPVPAIPVQPSAPGADAQARVAAALRGLSACSRLGGHSDEDHVECARQLAVHRDEQIDAVPAQMRQQQAAAEAQRAYVMSGASAALLRAPAANVPDHGRNISIHVKCSMKFGAGATGGMHCPGMKP